MRDKLNIFVTLIMLMLAVSCKTEAPIDLQENIDNQYQFSYSQSDIILYKNLSAFNIRPLLENNLIYIYSITPALPNGLVVDQNSGSISGTPQVSTLTANYYTITATSHLKITSATIKIEVKDEPLTHISYLTNPINFEVGLAAPVVLPVVSGGVPTYYEISPTLDPLLGLTFNPSNGQITGTPLKINTSKEYTVKAHNNGNSIETTLYLDIKERAPIAVTYPTTSFQLIRGNPMIPIPPIYTGGTPNTYAIAPPLPSGLQLNTQTGEFSGTPSLASALTNYTVSASNTGGSYSFSINITITDIAPNFGKNATGIYDFVSYTAVDPNISGKDVTLTFDGIGDIDDIVTSYNIANPAKYIVHNYKSQPIHPNYIPLPNDVWLNVGLNTQKVTFGSYKFSAQDLTGAPISLEFDGIKSTQTVVNDWNIANAFVGNTVTYGPAFPTPPVGTLTLGGGLSLASGTYQSITYTANNPGSNGNDITLTFDGFIDVLAAVLNWNVANSTNLVLHNYVAITSAYIPPAGIVYLNGIFPDTVQYHSAQFSSVVAANLNTITLNFNGTDTVAAVLLAWNIANFGNEVNFAPVVPIPLAGTLVLSGGSDSDLLYDFSQAASDVLSYNNQTSTLTLYKDISIGSFEINYEYSSGIANNFSVDKSLPPGITMDPITGIISGAPVGVVSLLPYQITGSNQVGANGGTDQFTLFIEVVEKAPSAFYYDSVAVNYIKDVIIAVNHPHFSGSTAYNYTVSPPLPAGLMLDYYNGDISGTPLEALTSTTYTVTVTNGGGSAQIVLTLGVQDSDPGLLTYTDSYMEAICNTPFILNYPQNYGAGTITNYYQIPGPVLPAGVTLDPFSGIISGIATQAMTTTQFQVMGSNNAGATNTSSPANVFLTVKPEKPDFRYDITQASKTHDSVIYTAMEYGIVGNEISLIFNGTTDNIQSVIIDWNINNPLNQVSENYTGNDLLEIPSAGTITLENGTNVIKLFMGQVSVQSPQITSCAQDEYFTNYSILPTGVTIDPATGTVNSDASTLMTTRQKINIGATNITDSTIKEVEIQIDYKYDPLYKPASSKFLKFNPEDPYQDLVMFTKSCILNTPPELCTDGHLIVFKGNFSNEYEIYSDTKIGNLEVPIDPIGTPEEYKFKPAINYAFNTIQVADLNGDGVEDLAVFDDVTSKLFILENYQANSASTRTFKFVKSFSGLSNINKAITKDLDADGKFDIVFSNNSNKINVLSWDDTLNTYKLTTVVFNAVDSSTNMDQSPDDDDGTSYGISGITDFVLIDSDGDGEIYDLVAIDENKNRVCVINGDIDYFFSDSCIYGFSLKGTPISMSDADFNQDGYEDIAVLLDTGRLDIYYGDGENFTGAYEPRDAEPAISKVIFATTPVGTKLQSLDTNDDTYKDIIISEPGKRTYTLEWDIILNDFRMPLLTEIPSMSISAMGFSNFELPGFAWFACNENKKSCGITQFILGTHTIAAPEPDYDDDW